MIKKVLTSTPFLGFVIFAIFGLFALSGTPHESVTNTSSGVSHTVLLESQLRTDLLVALKDFIIGLIGAAIGFLIHLFQRWRKTT